MNLYSMLDDAIRRFGGRTAIAYGDRSMSFSGLDQYASKLGDHLAALGCQPGDRVLLFLKNSFEYPVLLLAPMRAGLVSVPVNAKLHPREVAYICSNSEPRVVFTEREHIDAIRDALPDGPEPVFVAVEDLDLDALPDRHRPAADVDPDAPAWLFYTSGTTGRPKGAVLSHRNLIAATINCLCDIFDFRASDVALHVAPLSHGSGLYLIPSLVRGAENIISDRTSFKPDEILDMVAERGITVFAFLAPTMIVRLLDAKPRDDLAGLRGAIYGGASIHLEHIRAAVARFGPIFSQLYGQGEAPMTISGLPAPDHLSDDDELLRSAGYVRAGVEVRIVDPDGEAVADGEEGEIAVRGDVVMKGYWRNPEATAKTIRNGWLTTGDMGRFDAKGRLHILDRKHDTIISGGTNIYPKEVEDAIASHPGVGEVIAFGLPDREWGESVAVAVVRAPDHPGLGEGDILDHCRESLAAFKKPKRVVFLDALPTSAYGKVLRRELRETFASR